MTRVLVTGGRDFRDKDAVFKALDAIDSEKTLHEMIHGGASGADTLAGQWALENGVDITVYEADWAKLGPAAGPARNQQMLDDGKPDLVVAFPGGRGTADMVRRAKAGGVRVVEPR